MKESGSAVLDEVQAKKVESKMPAQGKEYVAALLADVRAKNPAEPEFHQAVQEVAESVVLWFSITTPSTVTRRSSSG